MGQRTATGVLTTVLGLVEIAAEEIPFPGVKTAVGGVLEIVKGINKTKQNKKALATLRDDLYQLSQSVIEPLSKANSATISPGLRNAVDTLVDGLLRSADEWQTRSKKPWIVRFFQRQDDSDDIDKFSLSIKTSKDRFLLASNVRQELQEGKIIGQLDDMGTAARMREISALLEELNPVKAASHQSLRPTGGGVCCEGTRVDALQTINQWMLDPAASPLFWLNGMAGVGKSTIALTVALGAEKYWVASFFCSRQEGSMRDSARIIPTLAYQLANLDAGLKGLIGNSLDAHRTIASESTNRQFDKLLLEPLRSLQAGHYPILLVLDALDECEDRGVAELLRVIVTATSKQDFPTTLKILVTSRPERHIRVVLAPSHPRGLRLQDIDKNVIDSDIRIFVDAEIARINLELELEMETDWITVKDKSSLVQRSEGLFVAASTMLRFIGDRGVGDPKRQLRILLGLQKAPGANRYEQLDQLYLQVLASSVASTANKPEVLDRFQKVVGSILLLKDSLPVATLARLLDMEAGSVRAALANLHSVINVPMSSNESPQIYHTSFREFLTSSDRCTDKDFLVVESVHEARLAQCCLRLMHAHLKRNMAGLAGALDPLSQETKDKIGSIISPELSYACCHWGAHLSRAKVEDKALTKEVEIFARQSLPFWIEALSLLGMVPVAQGATRAAHQSAPLLSCSEEVTTMFGDIYRLLHVDSDVLEASPLGIYIAIQRSPSKSVLFKTYSSQWPVDRALDPASQAAGIWSMSFSPRRHEGRGRLGGLERHIDWVVCVAFCPRGTCIASSSHDKTVCIWDIATERKVHVLKHPAWVNSISFLRDGSRLASGAEDGHLRLWDALSGQLRETIEPAYGPVTCIRFSPNGTLMAAAFFDTTIGVWDAEFTTQIATFTGHTYIVASLSFNPDATRLVSASWDATARLWDPSTGEHILTFEGHASGLNSVAYSPDGRRLASASDDKTVRLWDTATGEELAVLGTHSHWVASVAFSPVGSYVASAAWDGTGAVWDTTTLTRKTTLVPAAVPSKTNRRRFSVRV
ncbi:hypothetical protein R3P38DRAFT_3294478 [Favolaschia claudopus]|uniref:NACHT domain-containing protein n=1 Tax=Favolaschia claudopus TaxID=2862362 RepID=A0AAV9ZDG6_9AGAR